MNELISALVGLVLGVTLEDPLTRLRDSILHKYKLLVTKRKRRLDTSGLFTFGTIKSAWMVVDGNGEDEYTPKSLITHFDNKFVILPDELQDRKKAIAKEEEAKRKKGQPFHFNGENYKLEKFSINRVSTDEDLELQLWFRASDYYTFQATDMALDDEELRKKYIDETKWQYPAKYFANSFGVNVIVITDDNYAIFTKRSGLVGTNKEFYHISVNEGLSRTFDRGVNSQAPDIYRAVIRGVIEELGVQDVDASDVTLLSFGVDTRYSQWGILGKVHVKKTAEEILQWRARGVKDKWENEEFFVVKFTPDEVVKFVFEHEPWTPAGITCIYHTLVSEFTREKVDKVIEKYAKK